MPEGHTHRSLVVLLRIAQPARVGELNVEIWHSGGNSSFDPDIALATIQERPHWAQEAESVSLAGKEITVKRITLPPAVHFRRNLSLCVTSIYAAVIDKSPPLNGSWVPVEQILDQVDAQWRTILTGLCSQFSHAVLTGFLDSMAIAGQQQSTSPSMGTQGESSQSAATSAHPQGTADLDSGDRIAADETSFRPGCSGYEEETHAWGLDENDADATSQGQASSTEVGDEGEQQQASGEVADKEPVHWQSGSVAVVEEGGRDVQSVLDGDGMKMGVINWHAPWIEACHEIQPYMTRLAARFKSVAIIHLNVEHSMANKLLAYEKVLTRSESRRRGAKPIVRDNQSFPCLTVHNPSNLIPLMTYCGREALDQLAGALMLQVKELTEAPAQEARIRLGQSEDLSSTTGTAAAVDADLISKQPEQSQQEAADGQELPMPGNVTAIKKGAMELRQQLFKAKQTGRRVTVLWLSGTANHQEAFLSFSAAYPQDIFLQADVTSGKDNRQLAASLKVKSYPTIQVYSNLKLIKHVDNKASVGNLSQALVDAFATPGVDAKPAEKPAQAGPASLKSGKLEGKDAALKNFSDQKEVSPQGEYTPKGEAAKTFDPPVKASKAEQKRIFREGTGIYWPKMPCLRCGCPWWLGEDWDGRCARCGWTAEREGYDDDSQPLPKFKAKYKMFTDAIKAGKTLEWRP